MTLQAILDQAYPASDYPALAWQVRQWKTSRPFEGARLLDATPVFCNTLAKYVPLLAGGADLTVALSPLLPHDPQIAETLDTLGIPVVISPSDVYDVVMDCAGILAAVKPRAGFVELTKTGEHMYRNCSQPVILVDDSSVKGIETSLGTGDGLLRGLAHFGYTDLAGRSIVIFGAGKVGSGAAMRMRDAGAIVTVIDPHASVPGCASGRTSAQIEAAINAAWCVVTATGVAGALAPLVRQLHDSDAILANLGAEDEFGPDMPADRVLNAKIPINFALPEPTHLRYLDATLALVNSCALALLEGDFPPGLNRPPHAVEEEILNISRASEIGAELASLEQAAR